MGTIGSAPARSAGRFDTIQVLRGVAALLVVIDHCGQYVFGDLKIAGIDLDATLDDIGILGVQIFFVISGFIMVVTNAERFGSTRSAAAFFLRRLYRIAPLYYLATALMIYLFWNSGDTDVTARDIATSYAFVAHYADIEAQGYFPVLGVGWTLNYEMFFYLLFAISLMLRRRMGTAACMLAIVLLILSGYIARTTGHTLPQRSAVLFYTDPVMLLFVFGMAIGLTHVYRPIQGVPSSDNLLAHGLIAGAVVLLILKNAVDTDIRTALDYAVTTLAVIAVFVSSIQKTLSFAPLISGLLLVGDFSYSLYLTHSIVIFGYDNLFPDRSPSPAIDLPVLLLLSFAVGWATYRLIEQPIARFGARIAHV